MKLRTAILLATGFTLSLSCAAQEKRDPTAPKGGWVPPTAEELAKVDAA
ncbi:MAG: ThuA domain-containing protein, partial [Puniceicoccaceae bacterium]|nr:ThuA domain-containing protein [Puniceicoccaceae bacterium]